jgi:UDP-N-acetylmuramate dehydrogenase
MINISENISLSKFTSIKLGGKAKFFCECKTEKDLIESLDYAKTNNLKIQILGGGSNTIFSDEGFDGLVIKIDIKGIKIHNDFKDNIIIKASAGEEWDDFVKYCVENKFAGVECLSGIPGSVGATPIQNVGAYGQEVKDTIIFVKAIDRITYIPTMFSNEDCLFGYRTSRFKTIDKEKYIVTEVLFKLRKDGKPEIKYPELEKYLISKNNVDFSLEDVRNAVIELRKKKAMVIDENEPDSVSCGSFFVNPFLPEKDFENMSIKIGMDKSDIPHYIIEGGVKLSAAWLIENEGFKKGYTKNEVGISSKHSLALVNKGGTAKDLLDLAEEVQKKVFNKYGIELIKEPVIVS